MKSNKLRFFSLLLPLVILGFSIAAPVFAQTSGIIPPPPPPAVDCRGIVPCCEASGCNFDELIKAVKKVVNFGVQLALSFSVVVIAYAGFLYLTSSSNPNQRSQANEMFVKVLKGIFFILAAWVIVTLIMSALSQNVPLFLSN